MIFDSSFGCKKWIFLSLKTVGLWFTVLSATQLWLRFIKFNFVWWWMVNNMRAHNFCKPCHFHDFMKIIAIETVSLRTSFVQHSAYGNLYSASYYFCWCAGCFAQCAVCLVHCVYKWWYAKTRDFVYSFSNMLNVLYNHYSYSCVREYCKMLTAYHFIMHMFNI